MTRVAEIFESLEYGPAPESAGLVFDWLDAHDRRFGVYIGGAWVEPADAELFDSMNPATAKPIARVTQAGAAEVDAAVQAAREAQPSWAALGGHGRARFLYAIARHLQKHSRFFAVLESLDNGKPIRESRDIDIPLAARHFYHHAGWAQLSGDSFSDSVPVGVVGQIIPWNFPLLMLAWKIAPALAAGNTVVLKPAEFTPLTALRFAELCSDIGLPAGVVNIVTGDGRTGEEIVRHPHVKKIAFTGSTEVGRIIRGATAGSGKKLSLELGGKSPFIVFEDADLDGVVEGVVDAIWFNQGQVCCAGSRILAQEGIADRLIAKLRARMERLRVGDPLDKAIDIGAIIAPVQLHKIEELVQQGRDEGADVWQPAWSRPQEGWFYPPTLCTDVNPSATIAQVEIFGPVVVLMKFRTPGESIKLANNTRYGLAASVWSENINLALDIAPQLKAGTVWINCTNVFDAASGFGGYRESGFGREGGKEGMYEYLRPAWEVEQPGRSGGGEAQDTSRGGQPAEPRGAGEPTTAAPEPGIPRGAALDRTAKLYIGGRQVRPDQGFSLPVRGRDGIVYGEVGRGNRKDIRNAVEAAHAAAGWSRSSAHLRAQILYYLAENVEAAKGDISSHLADHYGAADPAMTEVDTVIRRLFHWAAWADKWDGSVHHTPFRNVTLAMPEPVGTVGIVCSDQHPLLGLVSAFAPLVALGNTVIAVPSETWPLAAADLYHVVDTSDMPGGVLNIVTGLRSELTPILASHDDVDGLWYFPLDEGGAEVERLSAGNMKRTWVAHGTTIDWSDPVQAEGEHLLRRATEVKNIWIPYGE